MKEKYDDNSYTISATYEYGNETGSLSFNVKKLSNTQIKFEMIQKWSTTSYTTTATGILDKVE